MLKGPLATRGYDWWWHNFVAHDRATGQARPFFVEYFVCNPALGGAEPVLGQDPANRAAGRKPSYAMVKVGHWGDNPRQVHNFYGIDSFRCAADRLDLSVGGCTLSETRMAGRCALSAADAAAHPEYMSDAGDISWDLTIAKTIAFNVGYGASPFFRALNAFEMFWHAEGIKTAYAGTVVCDGRVYDVFPERSFGYADKNWGGDFTSPWLWIASCNATSLVSGQALPDTALEFGGGRPAVFGRALDRRILGTLHYRGVDHDFNFSRFWTGAKTSFAFAEGDPDHRWTVAAENRGHALELELLCRRGEMLLVNYESPDGAKRHNRLWNGGTGRGVASLYRKTRTGRELVDRIEFRDAGCEYGEYCPPPA